MDSGVKIEELSITIKSIKVNNRKMTLSVFKQLPYENIVDFSSLELKGTPWGKVNYYWGDQKSWGNVHIVWSRGNELKRCLVKDIGDHEKYLELRYGGYEHESEYTHKLHELPGGVLENAIKEARDGGEQEKENAAKVFSKYTEIYSNFKAMDQLYIAT